MKNEKRLRVFKFTETGGAMYWAIAFDLQQAFDLVSNASNLELGDFIEATYLNEKELKESYLIDTNEYYDDDDLDEELFWNGYKIICTFYDRLKDETSPEFLTCSEF